MNSGANWLVWSFIGFCLRLPGFARSREAPSLRIVYNLWRSMALLGSSRNRTFAKHGLQHNLNYLAATTAVQAMVAGSEEIGLVGNQAVDVALEGADTVYVASTVSRFIFQLYGDPSIKSVGDLKGKVVAATQPSASTDMPRAWSCALGLRPIKT